MQTLVIITPKPPDENGRGYQRRTHQIVESLKECGIEPSIYCGKIRIRPWYLLSETVRGRYPLSVILVHGTKDFNPPAYSNPLFMTIRYVPPAIEKAYCIDFIDATSESLATRVSGRSKRGIVHWLVSREARLTKLLETASSQAATKTFAVTQRDAIHLGANCEVIEMYPTRQTNVAALPNGEFHVCFVGIFGYGPNDQAARWIGANIAEHLVQGELKIYGRGASRSIRRLPGFIGEFRSLDDLFDEGSILICPIVSGAGLQTKIIEAAARGVPCIVTSFVAEGLAFPLPEDIVVCELEHFMEKVNALRHRVVDRNSLRNWALHSYGQANISSKWLNALVPTSSA
jgi:Glycosyl transferases group 1